MTRKKVVVLDDNFPVPVRALSLITEHSHWWMGMPAVPEPHDAALHKAHNTVAAWLSELERRAGYPSFEETPACELHPKQAKLGVCPECRTNDGYLIVEDDVSAVCHQHRVRWPVTGRELGSLCQAQAAGLPDDDHERVRAYAVVEPAWLPGFAPDPEPTKRTVGHLREAETETFTRAMARTWWTQTKHMPAVPYGGRDYVPRFWRPAMELVKAALRSIRRLDDGSGSIGRTSGTLTGMERLWDRS